MFLDISLTWIDSSTLGGSSTIVFSVFRDSTLARDKCLGREEVKVKELLELQRQQPEKGELFDSINDFQPIDHLTISQIYFYL